MFTGIIETSGKVTRFTEKKTGGSLLLELEKPFQGLVVGASVAINGVCLTVVEIDKNKLLFDIVDETLNCTNLAKLKESQIVNLERPLKYQGSLDGHLVQGHVDGVGEVLEVRSFSTGAKEIQIKVPNGLEKYIIQKGSIAIDGISLTVANIKENLIEIAIIPHTACITNLSQKECGSTVNIEVDLVAKYLEKLNTLKALTS